MVLLLDGSSEHVAHVWRQSGVLRKEKAAVDVKILSQIKLPALYSELPSFINTMDYRIIVFGRAESSY